MRKNAKILVGFDGSVDSTVKPIKVSGTVNTFFSTIGEYGRYIAGKEGLSCSIQVEQLESHAGGNAPYVASALASIGYDVTLSGMFGKNSILPEFNILIERGISLKSFESPSFTQCFEFDDGKIMLANQIGNLENPFSVLSDSMKDSLKLIWESDLFAMLNWGEIPWMHNLWECAVDSIEINSFPDMEKIVFIDLADISCRTKENIVALLALLKKVSNLRYTILSMNENEMRTLGSTAFNEIYGNELMETIVHEGYASEVVLHTLKLTTAYNGLEFAIRPTNFVEKPLISTGAGDNFNAGYCAASIEKQSLYKKVEAANLSSHYYLTNGRAISDTDMSNVFKK